MIIVYNKRVNEIEISRKRFFLNYSFLVNSSAVFINTLEFFFFFSLSRIRLSLLRLLGSTQSSN